MYRSRESWCQKRYQHHSADLTLDGTAQRRAQVSYRSRGTKLKEKCTDEENFSVYAESREKSP